MIFDSKRRASQKTHSGLRHRSKFGGHGFDPRTAHITNSTYGMTYCEIRIIKDQNLLTNSIKNLCKKKEEMLSIVFYRHMQCFYTLKITTF